ncbi:hypothetical protein C8R44DRAFT_821963, partial [Mycena epipterygia]
SCSTRSLNRRPLGRASRIYYSIGVQGYGLFDLDPYHARPAVPLKPSTDKAGAHRRTRHHQFTTGAVH